MLRSRIADAALWLLHWAGEDAQDGDATDKLLFARRRRIGCRTTGERTVSRIGSTGTSGKACQVAQARNVGFASHIVLPMRYRVTTTRRIIAASSYGAAMRKPRGAVAGHPLAGRRRKPTAS
ncbi:hypothetical protein [Crateriforma spongiae]|uniref:hypothetical protein n=1 Tax=Crateriforma spongiae TaxID=2724528 RepID=UPI001448693D|nr:hypothetical protein [Crateriforma spongiae]